MSNVAINIAAEFTGKKAFKQAETSTDKLVKSTKRLAASIGLAFGTTQILAFGKASIKAALEAQAQQERLAAQVQSLNDQAAALQAIGVVNKENITQTQSQLATFNLQIDTIKALTPAILDYVTAKRAQRLLPQSSL
jgi:cytochrome bd-type quinol oxidase subunit 1